MCAAIELRKRGVVVDLVEIDPQWRVYGAGITIGGPTLRAFKTIGVVKAIMEQGWCADGVDMCLANGVRIAQLTNPRIAGPDVPGAGGIMRPVLARILSEATRACGTSVRLNDWRRRLPYQGAWRAVPECTEAEIYWAGVLACWRAVVPRPAEIEHVTMYLGRNVKAGVNPVSKDEMYLFFLDKRDTPDHLEPEQWPTLLRELLAEFHGPVAAIRDSITPTSRIIYRPLSALMLEKPWHQGRVVLIGDAAHSTTPHLASGAGIAVEDAIVLIDELEKEPDVARALERFTDRRFERCRGVVESSVRLGEIERSGGSAEEHQRVMREASAALLAPI